MELLLIQVKQALMFHETIHMFQFAVWIRSGQKDLPLSTDLLLVCYSDLCVDCVGYNVNCLPTLHSPQA